jgi:uncharacterized protein involved in exopolysaccharide biosynthesis
MHLPKPTIPPKRPQDTAANFKRYYYLILGRLWLILLIIAVGVGGTWAWLQRQPFIYASTATILVEQAEPRVIKMERVENEKPESAEFVLTAAQMLKSKDLMLRAAKALSLNKQLIWVGENPTAPNSLWTKSQGFSAIESRQSCAA